MRISIPTLLPRSRLYDTKQPVFARRNESVRILICIQVYLSLSFNNFQFLIQLLKFLHTILLLSATQQF